MVTRRGLLCLCLGILSTVNGCYVDPSPSDNLPYYGVDMHPETSQGHSDGQGIDYERQMDEQEQQYRVVLQICTLRLHTGSPNS